MSILLPDFGYADHSVIPLDWGGLLSGALGGPDQRLNRMGSRFSVKITTPPLKSASDGRMLFQRLMRARIAGALMCFPQSGVSVGAPGSPTVSGTVTGGSTVPMIGLTPNYAIREGQPFSIIHAGRRYLHFSDGQAIADGSGAASVAITPMLRVALSNGDVIELGKPMIEGNLEGDPVSWDRSAASLAPFTYTVKEAA